MLCVELGTIYLAHEHSEDETEVKFRLNLKKSNQMLILDTDEITDILILARIIEAGMKAREELV